MTRTIYYTGVTLDGFIATPDHSLDWLVTRDNDPDGPMGVNIFLPTIGAIAMGANTYQWILDHHPDDPWFYSVPSWVLTHRTFPERTDADIRFTQEPVPALHKQMTELAGDRDIWLVGGGDLVGQFADHGLLDEVCVSIAPVTIGAGAPLLPRHLELNLTELVRNGEFACARYQVVPSKS
ncbi:dihydrofolate reductase family protein [Nocardia sp. CDC159]|uniref:Dihydrofolate reductase family protein n=1 Tax=Nocardia pulmonis TaxID=2951408 RepID=A0A9X2EFV4_9NOCA|nr:MULTISPECIES: dihydrofolate reductase family protein [Nocardia]MCM6778113.1 dihydrofolate reductase family protein [Nocardia pulmonis]MCM6791002.1 dihydrofolate reductase family protein [Nocardia sp. CDC159]